MTPYDEIPLVPTIIADTVVSQPYTQAEFSPALRCGRAIARIEAARQTMTPAARREFADLCEARCRAAYESGARWMVKCARSKTDAGRNQLYVYISHWLAYYLSNPTIFRRELPLSV